MIIFSFFLSTKGNHWRHSVKLLSLKKNPKPLPQILLQNVPFLIGMFIEMLPNSCKCPHISHITPREAVLDPKEDAAESLNQNERLWRIESVWIVRTEHSIKRNKRGSFKVVDIREKITPNEEIFFCSHPYFSKVKVNAVEQCQMQHGSQFSWSHWYQTPIDSSGVGLDSCVVMRLSNRAEFSQKEHH